MRAIATVDTAADPVKPSNRALAYVTVIRTVANEVSTRIRKSVVTLVDNCTCIPIIIFNVILIKPLQAMRFSSRVCIQVSQVHN